MKVTNQLVNITIPLSFSAGPMFESTTGRKCLVQAEHIKGFFYFFARRGINRFRLVSYRPGRGGKQWVALGASLSQREENERQQLADGVDPSSTMRDGFSSAVSLQRAYFNTGLVRCGPMYQRIEGRTPAKSQISFYAENVAWNRFFSKSVYRKNIIISRISQKKNYSVS